MADKINAQAVKAIVNAVLMVVNKKLAEYDQDINAKLSGLKIGADNLLPDAVTTATLKPGAVTSETIGPDGIKADQVAGLDNKVQIAVQNANISAAQITDLNATVATIADAQIKNADIDFAQINGVAAGTVIAAEMVGDKLLINNLQVTEAMIGQLTTGELIVKGEDGNLYAITVDAEGNISTEQKYIVNSDIEDLTINAGEKIMAGSILAENIGANQITAQHLTTGSVTTAALAANSVDAGKIQAGVITTSHLSAEVGQELNLSSNESVSLVVQDKMEVELENYYDKEQVDSIQSLLNANLDIAQQQITSTVSQLTEMQTTLNGKADSSALEELATQMQQTAEEFTFIVNRTTELESSQAATDAVLENYQTSFQIDIDGVTIGKSGSDFDMHLDNTQLQFRQNGNVVAYVSNDKLFINKAEVLSEMKVGNYAWQVMEDNSMGLLYVG